MPLMNTGLNRHFFKTSHNKNSPPSAHMFCAVGRAFSSITTGCVSNTFLTVFHSLRFLRTAGFSGHFSCKAEKSLKLQDFPDFHVHPCTTIGKTEYENGVQEAASSNLVTRTNQRVVIYYNCIGAFDVPDRRKIPEADIIMETRKGVALSYAPEQVAV